VFHHYRTWLEIEFSEISSKDKIAILAVSRRDGCLNRVTFEVSFDIQ
jgi:hypothetical protein